MEAQTANRCTGKQEVACVLPTLFGGSPDITLPDNLKHIAHFEDSTQTVNLIPLTTAIATQLTLLPIPSPASGFTFSYDPSVNASVRTAQSFGPVLTERGETIGRGKVFIGFGYQRFRFGEIDGENLHKLPIVFQHDPTQAKAPADIITTMNNVDLKIDQFVAYGTVGLTNRLDVSIAIPIMDVRLGASSQANIVRLAGANELACGPNNNDYCHFFDPKDKANSTSKSYSNRGSASGIGDVVVRVKYEVYGGPGKSLAMSFLTDVRTPTGDEKNYLGAGAVGVKPFLALTFGRGRIAPHLNVGYQWNGRSLLAGDILTGYKRHLPGQFFYSSGIDVGVTKRLTIALDYLVQQLYNAPRVINSPLSLYNPNIQSTQSFPRLVQGHNTDYGVNSGAIGFKYNPFGGLLITANVLLQADSGGLRQRAVPLIGLSYIF